MSLQASAFGAHNQALHLYWAHPMIAKFSAPSSLPLRAAQLGKQRSFTADVAIHDKSLKA